MKGSKRHRPEGAVLSYRKGDLGNTARVPFRRDDYVLKRSMPDIPEYPRTGIPFEGVRGSMLGPLAVCHHDNAEVDSDKA